MADMKRYQTSPKKPGFLYALGGKLARLIFFTKYNVRVLNRPETIDGGFILMFNHQSNFDFIYSYDAFLPRKVNSVVAYYFFCKGFLAKILHAVGAFPKYQYQADMNAIRNIRNILQDGGIIGIAPEGRRCTYGAMETLAPATADMVKSMGVPVVQAMIHGAYFSTPKWAKTHRRGRIDVSYETVITAEEVKTLTTEEIYAKLVAGCDYDEFAWQKKERVCYKGRRFAEGLENILYLCPACGEEFTLATEDDRIFCRRCGASATLDHYYDFHSDTAAMPQNIRDWYLLQKKTERAKMDAEDYCLTAHVKLQLPGDNGGEFREVGEGQLTLTRSGVTYDGPINGTDETVRFDIRSLPGIIYRVGKEVEINHNDTLYYFVPDNVTSCAKWSVAIEQMYEKYQAEHYALPELPPVSHLPGRRMTAADYRAQVDTIRQKFGSRRALTRIGDGEVYNITYAELVPVFERISAGLLHAGVTPGARVAVIAPVSTAALAVQFALSYYGYVDVVLEESLPDDEKHRLFSLADVSAVFTVEKNLPFFHADWAKDLPIFLIQKDYTYPNVGAARLPAPKEPTDPEVGMIMFSSGTTGSMKGVQVTYTALTRAPEYYVWFGHLDEHHDYMDVLPSSHIAGYMTANIVFLAGGDVGVPDDLSVQAMLKSMQTYQPTSFVMVPKVYTAIRDKIEASVAARSFPVRLYWKAAKLATRFLRKAFNYRTTALTRPVWSQVFGKRMHTVGSGAAPIDPEVVGFYLDMGYIYLNVYASTEASVPISSTCFARRYEKFGSGNVHLFPDVKVKISQPNEEGIGEIIVRSPLMMKGYWKDDELTAASFTPEGYFKTGDLGYIDKTGELFVTGRAKESFILQNGKKVSAGDVDAYYQSRHGETPLGCCALMAPAGHDEVHLFIQTAGLSVKQQEELKDAILQDAAEAPSLYKLSGVHFIDVIPVTALGKVRRFLLVNELRGDSPKNAPKVDMSAFTGEQAQTVAGAVRKIAPDAIFTPSSRLINDVGLDSLRMFELCVELENQSGVTLLDKVSADTTVGDLIRLISTPK